MLMCNILYHEGRQLSVVQNLWPKVSHVHSHWVILLFYTIIVCSFKKDNHSLKAMQKILINSVGEVDYSAQETCHLLLQLSLIKVSRNFTVVNLDGSHAIEYHLQEIERANLPSFLDHCLVPPTICLLMTL